MSNTEPEAIHALRYTKTETVLALLCINGLGADITAPYLARILLAIRIKNPELLLITEPRGDMSGTSDGIFGARLTRAGESYLREASLRGEGMAWRVMMNDREATVADSESAALLLAKIQKMSSCTNESC